jgi:hypothetical protein
VSFTFGSSKGRCFSHYLASTILLRYMFRVIRRNVCGVGWNY